MKKFKKRVKKRVATRPVSFKSDHERRLAVLKKMESMTPQEVLEVSIRAGIYNHNGTLTRHYTDDYVSSLSGYLSEIIK